MAPARETSERPIDGAEALGAEEGFEAQGL